MIRALERIGDRLLSAFVPETQAAAASTAACYMRACSTCRCGSRSKIMSQCCNGVCSGCNFLVDCEC